MFLNCYIFKHETKPTQSTAPFKEPQALFGAELKQIIKPRVKQELRSILMPVNIIRSIRHLSSLAESENITMAHFLVKSLSSCYCILLACSAVSSEWFGLHNGRFKVHVAFICTRAMY